jgi:hypothetical protein
MAVESKHFKGAINAKHDWSWKPDKETVAAIARGDAKCHWTRLREANAPWDAARRLKRHIDTILDKSQKSREYQKVND